MSDEGQSGGLSAEDRRKLVHLSMTGFALVLRWLTPDQAAMVAGAAIVLNWLIMPLTGLGGGLRREGDPWIDGVKTYPVAVLILVLWLPLPEAAAAWAVLGVGDTAANIVGRRVGRPPFLWRKDRSLAGTLAFVLAGAPAALALWAWTSGEMPDGRMVVGALLAAMGGAVAELIPLPGRIDDNVPVALGAGYLLWLLG